MMDKLAQLQLAVNIEVAKRISKLIKENLNLLDSDHSLFVELRFGINEDYSVDALKSHDHDPKLAHFANQITDLLTYVPGAELPSVYKLVQDNLSESEHLDVDFGRVHDDVDVITYLDSSSFLTITPEEDE